MKKVWRIIAYIILAITAIIPRVYMLNAFTSPDEAQWERNTQNFVLALKALDFKSFYQQPHPGITTQWLGAPTINSTTWGIKRLPLALFLAASVIITAYFLVKLTDEKLGFLAGILLALNPQTIAHSRVLAMDALLATFLILSVVLYALWCKTRSHWYALTCGATVSLAILSKMSGIGILAFLVIITTILLLSGRLTFREVLKGAKWWLAGLVITTAIVFPTIFTNPREVYIGSKQFFVTEHYQQTVHAHGYWWYPQAFLIWSTPLHIVGLACGLVCVWRQHKYRVLFTYLLLFSIVFFLEIQFSIKKGDRYMLPVFMAFDVMAAAGIFMIYDFIKTKIAEPAKFIVAKSLISVITIAGIWQIWNLVRIHPHELAYRNPFFRSVAFGRTMGWGEGLDLAAEYLNQKPNVESMLAIAYYEGSFAYHFKGKFTSAERLGKESDDQIGGDYVVLYRTMQGRAADRWETKVLAAYKDKKPEHIISLNGEEYVWIYKVK